MKLQEITIGWPTNRRLAQDLEPLKDAMRLEKVSPGVLRTPDFPAAIFRELRAQDIAQMLEGRGSSTSSLSLGISGSDLMNETRIKAKDAARLFGRQYPGPNISARSENVLEIETDFVELFILMRKELIRKIQNQTRIAFPKYEKMGIVSSYPLITRESLQDFSRNNRQYEEIEINPVNGRTESIILNNDYRNIVAGVDVVRTGKTAEEFGLVAVGNALATSYPGLYQKKSLPQGTSSAVKDFIGYFREALKKANLREPTRAQGTQWDTVNQWSPPSSENSNN